MIIEWALRGKPSVLGIISGAVAGLAAITPASGFVDPTGALVIGLLAGGACFYGATGLKLSSAMTTAWTPSACPASAAWSVRS